MATTETKPPEQEKEYRKAMAAFRKALLLNPKAVIQAVHKNIEVLESQKKLDINSYNLGFAMGFADAFKMVGVKNGKLPTKH